MHSRTCAAAKTPPRTQQTHTAPVPAGGACAKCTVHLGIKRTEPRLREGLPDRGEGEGAAGVQGNSMLGRAWPAAVGEADMGWSTGGVIAAGFGGVVTTRELRRAPETGALPVFVAWQGARGVAGGVSAWPSTVNIGLGPLRPNRSRDVGACTLPAPRTCADRGAHHLDPRMPQQSMDVWAIPVMLAQCARDEVACTLGDAGGQVHLEARAMKERGVGVNKLRLCLLPPGRPCRWGTG